jgi:hypothetical protein
MAQRSEHPRGTPVLGVTETVMPTGDRETTAEIIATR